MSAEDVSEDAQNFYPLYAKPGINEGVLWQFQDEDRITTINDSSGQIKAILERSNGHNSVNEIFEDCERAGVKTDRIESVMRDLRRLGIIVDSRELGIEMHGYTNNPQAFTRPLTNQDVLDITFNDTYLPKSGSEYSPGTTTSNTLDLSKMRESCRNFLPIAIDSKGIMTCLQSSYSAEHHPVPSAGGLYPLRMYLIQKIGSPELPEGLYQYDHTNHHLIRIDEEVDEIDLSYVFGSEDLLHNAPTVVVIAAALDRHNSKYANRGYRYTLLEAGHSAQNIHITAQELGISTLEYGGFKDDDLAAVFNMPKRELPLVTIAMGYKNIEANDCPPPFDTDLVRGYEKPVEWSAINFNSPAAKLLRFYTATAKFKKPNSAYSIDENLFAAGTASSPQLAEIKATAEAFERYTAGQVRYDFIDAAINLDEGKWLSPEIVRPRSDEQLQNSSFTEKFDPAKPIEWLTAKRTDGQEIYVPIDLVFYPISPTEIGRLLVAEVDSSGMAAHTITQEAAKRALLELIERDAIMKTWLTKKAPPKINLDSLPSYYKKRAKFWSNLGKIFEVLDYSHDDIAIAGVVIRSEDDGYPYMVNGASASVTSFEDAVKKASYEAELGMAESITAKYKAKKLSPQEVFSPADHAAFYAYPDHSSAIEWLWGGQIKDRALKISGNNNPFKTYDAVTIKLTSDKFPLQVVRVIAPDLVPITFGYGNEPYLHPTINHLGYTLSPVPHFFA